MSCPFDARLGRCSLTIRVGRAVQMLNTIHMRKRRKSTIKCNLCVPRENRTRLSEVSSCERSFRDCWTSAAAHWRAYHAHEIALESFSTSQNSLLASERVSTGYGVDIARLYDASQCTASHFCLEFRLDRNRSVCVHVPKQVLILYWIVAHITLFAVECGFCLCECLCGRRKQLKIDAEEIISTHPLVGSDARKDGRTKVGRGHLS
jgi:hypothetical protein